LDPIWTFLWPLKKLVYKYKQEINLPDPEHCFSQSGYAMESNNEDGQGYQKDCPILNLPSFTAYPTVIRTGWQKLLASVHSLFSLSASCLDIFVAIEKISFRIEEVNHNFF
jgi:hypothetical protein